LARQLSGKRGIVDAYQTGYSIEELIAELYGIIHEQAESPAIIIGHSWGAWLALMFAARHPGYAEKLILIASAPFEDQYVPGILETRLSRMPDQDREKYESLLNRIATADDNIHSAFKELAGILRKTDAYNSSEYTSAEVKFNFHQYNSIWSEAERLRSGGELLEIAGSVNCPVLAIHGDHDPHPAEGVRIPLEDRLTDLRFWLLEKCGHEPWNEIHARQEFFSIMEQELT
jgi:pimeloyl-ACP methyl ester carboxylesterase